MKLSDFLISEIESYNETEPSVRMWVDQSSIFWITKDEHYVWLAENTDINAYVDAAHFIEERQTPEGVYNQGVEWNNSDFECPFHVSDFSQRAREINVFA